MSSVWTIARKELRSYFGSAVALIFLATFLAVVLFSFFWVEKFFARNITDVRPMFEWLPILLIFLVSALTMRMWSEEQKVGTLEVLLTLPIPLHQLVLGKFIAGLLLVALALALTFGLPITVSTMGDIDWGPVFGGYQAALLLAAAYLAIGLCISSITDNQVVALVVTVLICAVLYLPGSEALAGSTYRTGELLRALSTGSRFESIARGVIDIRDLAYWFSITAFFLTLNTFLLASKRWSHGQRGASQRRNSKLAVALVALNAVALNLWLAPMTGARIDLTEDGEYSLSPVTHRLLGSLDETLIIRGYFSEKTHPFLAPLVPQIRDRIAEYEVAGKGMIRAEFIDPSENEEAEEEARSKYKIESFPFRFSNRRERSVVNSYYHILIQYGDQFEVLSVDDIVEARSVDPTNLDIGLRNLEYDITRAIRKVVYGFQTIDSLFAVLSERAKLTLFYTPDALPENFKDSPDAIAKVADELTAASGGMFEYEGVVISTSQQQQELLAKYGFQPFATSPLSQDRFYLHLLLEIGGKLLRIDPPDDMSETTIRKAIRLGIQRGAPGMTKTIGIYAPPARAPLPPDPSRGRLQPQQQPAPQNFRAIGKRLRENFEVRDIPLTERRVPDEIDVLLIAGPDTISPDGVYAVDQFLMGGGAVIIMAGRYRLDNLARDLAVETVTTGLEDAMATWGIEVDSKLILDETSDFLLMPVVRKVGNMQVRDQQRMPYPFFVRVKREGMSPGNIITGNLNGAILHFASPLALIEPSADAENVPKVSYQVLMSSSEKSWTQINTMVQPDFRVHPDRGFGKPKQLPEDSEGPHPLLVTFQGEFVSHFADAPAKDNADSPSDRTAKRSVPDARLIVIGSSSFVSDEMLRLSRSMRSEAALANMQLLENLIDWAVVDTDLLEIRSRGAHTRLIELEEDERGKWEVINYVIVALGLLLVAGFVWIRQRRLKPLELTKRAVRKVGGGNND